MTDDPWKSHIRYLEEEVEKIGARADKLEAFIPGLESERKKIEFRAMVGRMRDEANEHRKYLALVGGGSKA